jgi:hypothetical protein
MFQHPILNDILFSLRFGYCILVVGFYKYIWIEKTNDRSTNVCYDVDTCQGHQGLGTWSYVNLVGSCSFTLPNFGTIVLNQVHRKSMKAPALLSTAKEMAQQTHVFGTSHFFHQASAV